MTPRVPALQAEEIQQARQRARLQKRPLMDELAERSGLEPGTILTEIARCFGFRKVETLDMHGWQPAFDLLPLPQALHKGCALFREGATPIAAIADPFDHSLQAWLECRAGAPIEFRLALAADIDAYLARHEESARAIESLAGVRFAADRGERSGKPLSLQAISANASPIVRIVDSILYDALKAGASDIHIETGKTGIVVKYRLDGVLARISTVPGNETGEQVISRIKVMAELDIAERRVPQDGRFKVAVRDRDIDVRVSIIPSIHGEDAVLRVLDKHTLVPAGASLNLEALGFERGALWAIRRLAGQPYGMLLVTGPTGSGKTTTLYAAISEINRERDKIVTIEDPVEYELPGVLQIPVNEKKGLTFARGLRSILRHDPDKIMVGEIRDAETAEIAVQSALTGHLVLTTLHANNVFDVFSRFTHMGIDPYALTSALNGVWAQRLLRTVCRRCATDRRPGADELAAAGLAPEIVGDWRFRQGRGCDECRGSGYKGRRAVAEILALDDRLRELIATRSPLALIREEAARRGTRFLRQAALDLVRQGQTTLDEVDRVTLQG